MLYPDIRNFEVDQVQVVRAGREGPLIAYLPHAGEPRGNIAHISSLAKVGQVFSPNMHDLAASLKRDGVKNPNFGDMAHKFNALNLTDPNKRIHFVTCSWGSSLALQCAAEYPQAVASITAASPTGWPIDRSTAGWVGSFVWDNIQKFRLVPANLRRRDLGGGLFAKQIMRNGPAAMLYALKMTMAIDDREILPKVQTHVELLSSTQDYYIPASGAEEMQRLIPNSRLRIVSKLNHLWYVFESEKFINVAIEQIRQTA